MSLKRIAYVAHKTSKGGSKTQDNGFPSKSALYFKKVCYKVSLCEYCQQQSCKVFTDLSIRAKTVRGGRPPVRENLAETRRLPSKTPISNQYSLVAPRP